MIIAVKPLQPSPTVAAAAHRPHALAGQVDGVVLQFVRFRTGAVGRAGGAVRVSLVGALDAVAYCTF